MKSNHVKLVLAQAVGLLMMSNTALATCGYSSLVSAYNGHVYIGNRGCDVQNAIVGSPNSAGALMFQQDFDMSGVAMSLDDATESSINSAEVEEIQPVALDSSLTDGLNASKLEDAVYRPGHESGHFLTMGYPASAANNYRFVRTGGISETDKASLNALNDAGMSANYSGIGNSDAVTLPIDHKIRLDNGYVLSLNLPLSYIENNATSNISNTSNSLSYYSASLGTGLTIPLSHLLNMKNVWSLTILGRVGGIDSDSDKDKSSAIIYSTGILSQYDMRLAGGVFGIKNMLSYNATSAERELGFGVSQNDLIEVGVFRNGVYYSHYLGPVVFGRKLTGTLFFTDTRFTVPDEYAALHMDSMQQVGFNLGLATKRNRTGSFARRLFDAQDMRIGMSYTTADLPQNKTVNIDGFGVNFGYTF